MHSEYAKNALIFLNLNALWHPMRLAAKSGEMAFLGLSGHFLSILTLICAFIASLSVLANNAYYFLQYGLTPSVALFLLALISAFLPGIWGLALVISLLPLTAGIPSFLNALLGINTVAMPNPGLDLVAGVLLGVLLKNLIQRWRAAKSSSNEVDSLARSSPWPVGLVLLMITISAVLAIARNLYLSATSTSLRGALFNLMHFRPMDWRADYLPLGNWVAYALAGGLIFLVIALLRQIDLEKRNRWIFRSLMFGLAISAIVGLIQAATGLGLPEAQLGFRKDAFGYAAMGLHPDLHSFAAHMLFGVVGLWGYFLVCKNRVERFFILTLFLLCIAGLVASKSRASLFIALVALVILGLIYCYRHSKKLFVIFTLIFLVLITIIFIGAGSIPGLAWIGDLVAQIQSRRLDSWSDLGGMMGSRFEIWSAVANMFSAYPFMGVGEGEFYHLSSNISFARSEFLQLNRGENAHNYFLQVLAENGLVGVVVFAIAFIIPYRACQNKHLILPASIGLLSLFLGNIFAHSFLVRENLLIGATLLGLIYSFSGIGINKTKSHALVPSGQAHLLSFLAVFILLVGMVVETLSSFGKMPFIAGADCFIKDVRSYPDGWTSGAWEELLPKGAKGLELVALPNHSNIQKQPIRGRLEMLVWIPGSGKVSVNVRDYQWTANAPIKLDLDIPAEYTNSPHVKSVRLQLSSCYTPRNLGINTDSRRLGVQIKELRWK
jgi:O-antigen ligase